MERNQYLALLKKRKNEYRNEIPDEVLHSAMYVGGTYVNPKFKCRKGWFQLFYTLVELGISYGYVNLNARILYRECCHYFRKTNLGDRELVWKYDIERANEVLDYIIACLEKDCNSP